jgi:sulfatase modifying factor 1
VRGGLEDTIFCWGNELTPSGRRMANAWQGQFPSCSGGFVSAEWLQALRHGWQCIGMDGGLVFVPSCGRSGSPLSHAARIARRRGGAEVLSYDPEQPTVRIPRKVIEGGSYLCAANYCRSYRPAARHPRIVDTSTCHIGFRCVVRMKLREKRGET